MSVTDRLAISLRFLSTTGDPDNFFNACVQSIKTVLFTTLTSVTKIVLEICEALITVNVHLILLFTRLKKYNVLCRVSRADRII